MQTIELYIEGQRLDLFDDESVSLTQTIKDARDVSKVFTSFTQTFNVPASKNNNKIFKHYYNFNIDGGFDARIKKSGSIELNSFPFKIGKIKLEGVKLKDNIAYSYSLTFYGNTVNLVDLLGEDKLNTLTDLDSLSELYTSAEVKSRLQLDPTTNDLITPLITHTTRLYYDSDVDQGNEVDGNLYFQQGNGHNHGVLWSDLKYALRISKIVEAIETRYSLTFSSDFFTATNLPYYNLFMWLHRKSGNVGFGTQLTTFVTTVNGWNAQVGDISQMSNSSTFRSNLGDAEFQYLSLSLTRIDAAPYSLSVFRNGIEVQSFSDIITANKTIFFSTGSTDNASYTVQIQHLVSITFTDIVWEIQGLTQSGNTERDTYQTSDNGNFIASSDIDFTITSQIPNMKVLDFLTGLFKMFNLIAYEDDSGVIVIKTLDSFYSTGVNYDISDYLDVTSSQVNIALPFKEIVFGYKDTKTFLAAVHNQIFSYEWAKEQYNDNATANLDGGIYKVEAPFGHFKFERIIDLADSIQTTIQWGYCVDDNQSPYIGAPFLFYPIKQTNGKIISFRDNLTQHTAIDDYIVPSNSLSLSSATSTDNINFKNENNEYEGGTAFVDTLFQKYYSNYIASIFNSKNRLTKVTAYLPPKILLKFTLADRFDINGSRYKINSIRTNLKTGKSDIELLNDL
tara:strand:+ start:4157 stop:6190 length:2034 start_codon:yes stop_codon:yes gene_type:complete